MKRRKRLREQRRKKIQFRIKCFLLLTIFLASVTVTSAWLSKTLDFTLIFPISLENMNHQKDQVENRMMMSILEFFSPRNGTHFLSENNHAFLTEVDPDEEISLEDASKLSDYVKENTKPLPASPTVYLYNTHQREQYNMEALQPYNITPNVMMASYMLQEALKKKDISSVVEENDVTKLLTDRKLNYAASYQVTKELMTKAKEKYHTLEYFIDLHRDSVSSSISTVEIEKKHYAKVMFLVGLENDNYEENLSFITTINDRLEQKYPGISRGIWKKGGKGVNGIYNQDFNSHTILIEVGGEENTIEEVYHTIEALAEILAPLMKGE